MGYPSSATGSDTIDGGDGDDLVRIQQLSAEQNRYYVQASATGFNVTADHYGLGTPDVLALANVEGLEIDVKGNEQVVLKGNLTGLSVEWKATARKRHIPQRAAVDHVRDRPSRRRQ